jgi:hypothetical protein
MNTFNKKCLVVLLVSVLGNLPLYADCSIHTCDLGPPVLCDQLIYNNSFNNTDCEAWVSSNVDIVTEPAAYASFSGSSSALLYQSVYVPTGYNSNEIDVEMDITGSSSTAALYVEIRSSTGVLLQTLDLLSTSSPDGGYQYGPPADAYEGQTIRLQFRYVPGSNPGNAEFRITNVDYFLM